VNKTQFAFETSCAALFDKFPVVTFWTITSVEAISHDESFKNWNRLMAAFRKAFGADGFPGVRVVEVHPGTGIHSLSHGLHFHCLIGARLPIRAVLRMGRKIGFGRTECQMADRASVRYLAKYLSKRKDGLPGGRRRWGFMGGFKATSVRDVQVRSTLTENCQRVKKLLGGRWGHELYLEVFRLTKQYGNCLNWPCYPELVPVPDTVPADDRGTLRLPAPDRVREPLRSAAWVPGGKPAFGVREVRLFESESGQWVTHRLFYKSQNPF